MPEYDPMDPAWVAQHEPKKVVVDGVLYVDGVPVPKKQLTPEEIKQYFPEEYFRDYTREERPCPLCKGMTFVIRGHLLSIQSHLRKGHPKWYEQFRDTILALENADQVLGFVRGVRHMDPDTMEIDNGDE